MNLSATNETLHARLDGRGALNVSHSDEISLNASEITLADSLRPMNKENLGHRTHPSKWCVTYLKLQGYLTTKLYINYVV